MTYPTIMPALTLDFQNSQQLDPRVTFSRSSGATYINSAGLVVSAADHEPRFDHDPVTGECLGLLIEESRTNLFENSVFSTFSDWQNSDKGTLVANAAVSPDGTSTAAEYTQSAQYDRAVNLTIAQPSPLVFSCFVRPVDGDIWTIGSVAWQTFGTGTYTFSTQQWSGAGLPYLENYGVEELANGWYRLWVAFGATATGGNTLIFRCDDADISGVKGYVWGVQLSTGSFPTSYIPTAGAASTRAADTAHITGTSFSSWYNQSEGTMFVSMPDGSRSHFGANLYGSTTSNRMFTSAAANLQLKFQAGGPGSNVNLSSATGVATADPMQYAYAYKPLDYAFSVKGDIKKDTLRDPQPTLVKLKLGEESAFGGGQRLNGAISRIAYYNERLTDAELQTLTL